MTPVEKLQLQITACKVRMGIIDATHGAKAGHPGGSLSAAELFTYLYFKEMNIDPKNPKWEDRDRFVLSKGHTAPGLYAALAHRGFFPVEAPGFCAGRRAEMQCAPARFRKASMPASAYIFPGFAAGSAPPGRPPQCRWACGSGARRRRSC